MVILVVLLVYFGSAMYMLQLNALLNEERVIVTPVFQQFLIDSTLNQYMLMLGEFHMDGFEINLNKAICYGVFIASTFISQIILLNMLIAIMGDTYDRVQEKRNMLEIKSHIS